MIPLFPREDGSKADPRASDLSVMNASDSHNPGQRRPAIAAVLETALVVEDVARATRFYRELFGFEVMAQSDRLCSLDVRPGQVLLLFRRGGSLNDISLPGGVVPGGMDAEGRGHMAFAIAAADLEPWRQWLQQNAVAVESTVVWERQPVLPRSRWQPARAGDAGSLGELLTPAAGI